MPIVVASPPSARLPLAPGEFGYAGYPAGLPLGPWPMDLGDLRLDRVDEFGGLWNVTEFVGKGSAPTTLEVNQRVNASGAWIGNRFWAAKPYTITGAYEGESPADRHAAEQRLLGSVGVNDTPLVMHEEVLRQTTVVLNGEISIDPAGQDAFTFQIPLLAPDPFRYSTEPFETWTRLPSTSGGATWPATWPKRWPATVSSGLLTAFNTGTEGAHGVFRVYGPLPDFTLSQPSTGKSLTVDLTRSGAALVAGEWVEVDMRRERVLLLGQSSRKAGVRGEFFGCPPGESRVRFTSSAANGEAWVAMTIFGTWI